jgi:hypothetical protein
VGRFGEKNNAVKNILQQTVMGNVQTKEPAPLDTDKSVKMVINAFSMNLIHVSSSMIQKKFLEAKM